jgi:hypothetical protein
MRYVKPGLKSVSIGLAAVLVVIIVVTGCSEKGGGVRYPNLPPDTFISSGPKQTTCNPYTVQTYWFGVDMDGRVEEYEVAAIKGLTSGLAGTIDYDSLAWGRTASRDSIFLLETDSCCTSDDDKWFDHSFWGVAVRAIDNERARDPVPATIFFQTCNAIPKVNVTEPPQVSWDPQYLPAEFFLEWEGEDPDGDESGLWYKYIIVPDETIVTSGWPALDEDSTSAEHEAPPVGYWSGWVPPDCTFVNDINLSEYVGTDEVLWLAVTARDEAGGILPEQLYGSLYNMDRNYRRFVVGGSGEGVNIVLDAGILGRRDAYGSLSTHVGPVQTFEGVGIAFKFWGLEDRGSGRLAEAYRYYYDTPGGPHSLWVWTDPDPLREVGSPIEWMVKLPPDGGEILPSLGNHVFVVEMRDAAGTVTHVELPIEVVEGPAMASEDKILLVDDNRHRFFEGIGISTQKLEDSTHAQWADILDGTAWEMWDTGVRYGEKVSGRSLGLATTVIWDADFDGYCGGSDPWTQLLDVCAYRGHFLHSYVKAGGNLIIIGRSPVKACAYWPDLEILDPARRCSPPRTVSLPFMPSHYDYDFRPLFNSHEKDTLYNFMWDIFGIERMEEHDLSGSFNALLPCGACGAAWQDTILVDDRGSIWSGAFQNEYYITGTRRDDAQYPLDMELIYGTGYYTLDGEGHKIWQHTSGDNVIGVYVPAHDGHGHAAYISVPPYWFEHAKMKVMIRTLLERFDAL